MNNQSRRIGTYRSESGFTLVELATVITLLGVLGAFIVPRFVNVSDDAELAVNQTILSNFRAAVSQHHLKWLVNGENAASININGNNMAFSNRGFPTGSTFGTAGCQQLWRDLLQNPPDIGLYNPSTPPA